jgi:AraC family transcriptional regulator of adaptative response/methylated-DNA-[protein]-cysteine methyltransferase
MVSRNSSARRGAPGRRRPGKMTAMHPPTLRTPAPGPTAALFATDTDRYQALADRDARAEGLFFYSVATTGVYCRPTCAARLPRRENVAFHRTPQEAERAGFRACKRCRPREAPLAERQGLLVAAARERLETADAPVPLADLAAAAGLSPFHFHRLFRQRVGMTPRQYAAASRLQRFGAAARSGATVTAALYEAGYSSSGRFYESSGVLGMPPAKLGRGGEGIELRALVRPCSLGQALIAATARGICAVTLGDDGAALTADLRARFPRARVLPPDRALEALAEAVVALIDGAGVSAELPLDLVGTAFQQKVWRALRDIPPGSTTSYAELARRIGSPRAVRAVGTACGANPIAVAVPCHRVVRGDGALGGYRWGLARKKALLARERAK